MFGPMLSLSRSEQFFSNLSNKTTNARTLAHARLMTTSFFSFQLTERNKKSCPPFFMADVCVWMVASVEEDDVSGLKSPPESVRASSSSCHRHSGLFCAHAHFSYLCSLSILFLCAECRVTRVDVMILL